MPPYYICEQCKRVPVAKPGDLCESCEKRQKEADAKTAARLKKLEQKPLGGKSWLRWWPK